MKIILLKHTPELGNAGDIVDVSPGYARNFLFKKQLAREATPHAIAEVGARKKSSVLKKEKKDEHLKKAANVIENAVIPIRVRANEEGVLFGGIGPVEIAAAIVKKKRISLDPKQVLVKHHLKTLGKHKVVINLGGGTHVACHIDIISEA